MRYTFGNPGGHTRRTRRTRRAYTAVEVLISLGVLAIGAAGVMTMQRTSVLGNADARRMDVATAVSRTWLERLRTEAALWTIGDGTSSNFAAAPLFGNHLDGGWYLPTGRAADTPAQSPGFDPHGRDLPQASIGAAAFCVHARLTTLVPTSLVRADVRVIWPRNLARAPDDTFCTALDPTQDTPDLSRYHLLYATTALRKNAAP